jgi:type IV pilus assembly protein PilW
MNRTPGFQTPPHAYALRSPSQKLSRSAGLTLIELMLALVLGLFLVGGVISVYLNSQQAFKATENLARLQESARFAFEQMGREIRDAGNNPCGVKAVSSVVRSASGATPWWADWNSGVLVGYESNVAGADVAFGTSVNNRVTSTDAITVLRPGMDDSNLSVITSHFAATNTFNLSSSKSYEDRDVVFACDSGSGAIFDLETSSNAKPGTIDYTNNTLSANTFNCASQFGGTLAANCTGAAAKTFTPGGFVAKYEPAFWYIGVGDGVPRSLYRYGLTKRTVAGVKVVVAEKIEMVTGVHDMQLEYLTRDRTKTVNKLATTWIKSDDAIFSAVNKGWTVGNDQEVVAVRMTLTFRSPQAVGTDGLPLERKTVSVISLRNRDI